MDTKFSLLFRVIFIYIIGISISITKFLTFLLIGVSIQDPETTQVMGTIGYIAPKVTSIGKVTLSSDVFSFGVVLLEVACGRRLVDLSKDNE